VVGFVQDVIDAALDITATLATLARLPLVLVARIKGVFTALGALFTSALARFGALFRFGRFAAMVPTAAASGAVYCPARASTMAAAVPWVPAASAAQVEAALQAATTGQGMTISDRMAANRAALVRLVSDTALSALIRTSAATTYDSAHQALETRDTLSALIEERMQTADDPLFVALGRLQATMVQDLTQRAATLDQLVAYSPPATIPALVLAHRLYGDARKGADIVTRNAIRNPGMVPGGAALTILAKGSNTL
jgi:prophage DNA circulation protein